METLYGGKGLTVSLTIIEVGSFTRMSHTCHSHVTRMSLACHTHVTRMSHTSLACHTHVTRICL